MDIDDGLEEISEVQRGEHAPGVAGVCVGKDQFPAGERSDHLALDRVRGQVILQGQVMHEGQEFVRIHLVAFLQAAQGGAIHLEVLLAQGGRVLFGNAEALVDVQVDAPLDGLPQTGGAGVERIVEVEEEGGKTHPAIIPSGRGLSFFSRGDGGAVGESRGLKNTRRIWSIARCRAEGSGGD